jgi:hypothetical protein
MPLLSSDFGMLVSDLAFMRSGNGYAREVSSLIVSESLEIRNHLRQIRTPG